MAKIVVSECLTGVHCLYHGGHCTFSLDVMSQLSADGHTIIPVCPEMLGGLPCPRPPTRLRKDGVLSCKGVDVRPQFNAGRDRALEIAGQFDLAITLKNSPSCDPERGVFGSRIKELGIPIVAAKRGNGWEDEVSSFLGKV